MWRRNRRTVVVVFPAIALVLLCSVSLILARSFHTYRCRRICTDEEDEIKENDDYLAYGDVNEGDVEDATGYRRRLLQVGAGGGGAGAGGWGVCRCGEGAVRRVFFGFKFFFFFNIAPKSMGICGFLRSPGIVAPAFFFFLTLNCCSL